MRDKILLTEKLMNGALVTPTPDELTLPTGRLPHWLSTCYSWYTVYSIKYAFSFVWLWSYPLQWHHYEHDGIPNHQTHDCLLKCLFKHRSKKTSKLRITGLCEGNSPVNSEGNSPVNSLHKGPVTRKMFPFDDVIMSVTCYYNLQGCFSSPEARIAPMPGKWLCNTLQCCYRSTMVNGQSTICSTACSG